MMTHFGHDQIASDLRMLRRLETLESLDVEQQLLRGRLTPVHTPLPLDCGMLPAAPRWPDAAAQLTAEPPTAYAPEQGRPARRTRRGWDALRVILASLRHVQQSLGD